MHQAVHRASLRNAFPLTRGALAGLGASTGPSTTQIVQQAGAIASTATTAALGATVGSSGFILGMSGALAIPLVGAAIAGVTLGIVAILNSGCGQSCIVTSNWANQAADLLEKNIQAYFGLPAPRTAEQKAQALANFDQVWNYLFQQCNNPSLGSAGTNCINDRKAGACKWHQTGNPEFPGQPATGQCWNWFNAYRDPIAQDPAVVTSVTVDPSTAGSVVSSSVSTSGFDSSSLFLFGGIGLLVLAFMGGR